MPTFRRLYGDRPLQLLTLLACFLVAGYAASRLVGNAQALRIGVWFLGAAIVWDFVLSPLIELGNRVLRPLRTHSRSLPAGVPALNYVRVPALLSALLLLMFTPMIFQRSEGPYFDASGLEQDPYLGRWLLVTVLLFAGAALTYAAAVLRARTAERDEAPPGPDPAGT
jgi:hypothetical protein